MTLYIVTGRVEFLVPCTDKRCPDCRTGHNHYRGDDVYLEITVDDQYFDIIQNVATEVLEVEHKTWHDIEWAKFDVEQAPEEIIMERLEVPRLSGM